MRISFVKRDCKQRAKSIIISLTSKPATTYLTDSQVLAVVAKSKTSLIRKILISHNVYPHIVNVYYLDMVSIVQVSPKCASILLCEFYHK
jgi:hypothetical protein